jgi:hypothetical protein
MHHAALGTIIIILPKQMAESDGIPPKPPLRHPHYQQLQQRQPVPHVTRNTPNVDNVADASHFRKKSSELNMRK